MHALTCPLVILTLGLFILVINGLLLLLTSSLVRDSFVVDGFGTAFVGGIVMGIAAIDRRVDTGSARLGREQASGSGV